MWWTFLLSLFAWVAVVGQARALIGAARIRVSSVSEPRAVEGQYVLRLEGKRIMTLDASAALSDDGQLLANVPATSRQPAITLSSGWSPILLRRSSARIGAVSVKGEKSDFARSSRPTSRFSDF